MFLTSEAFQALDGGHVSPSDWHRTTALLISYEWDLREGGPEALAGLRLVARLRDAGARLHVLTAVGTEQHVEPNYQVTVVPPMPVARSRPGRAWQMIRSGNPEPHCLWVQSAVQAGLRVPVITPGEHGDLQPRDAGGLEHRGVAPRQNDPPPVGCPLQR